MKLQRYLKERYFNAVQHKGLGRDKIVEIWKNPNRQDMKEAMDTNDYGLRFFADMRTKDIYVWNSAVIHWDMLVDYKRETGKSLIKGISGKPEDYYAKGIGFDFLFTGTIDKGTMNVESDSWGDRGDVYTLVNRDIINNDLKGAEETMAKILTMGRQDTNWMNKYGVNGNKVKSIIDKTVETIENEFRFKIEDEKDRWR